MKYKGLRKLAALLLTAALAAAFTGCAAEKKQERTKDIAVMYTGDVHCAVEENIGYAGVAAYKKSLENDGCEVLLVDTGDAVQGAAIGSFSKGEDIIRLMNEVGYNAMTLGNHEFDYGGPAWVAELLKNAKFPFLSVNLQSIATGAALYPPYTIIERDGVKLAFIGVSTPETLTSSTPAYFMDENGSFIYDFMNDKTGEKLYAAVQKSVDAARKEGADYVIALTHLGVLAEDEPFTSNDLIAATSGIDAVLDGHAHVTIECARVKNRDGERVLLSSTGTRLQNIGLLWIDRSGNMSTGLVSEVAEKDASVTALIEQIKEKYNEKMNEVVGRLESGMLINDPVTDVRIVRRAETNLGDFCADAFRAAGGADIAFANGGGIRTGIKAGDITYGDMLTVMPFGNLLCKSVVSGQTILDALELSVSKMPGESGGFLQVSGITFEIDMGVESGVKTDENGMFLSADGERRVKNVMVGGEALDAEKQYSVVSVNYILKNGGNGYSMFSAADIVTDEFMLDVDALTDYMNAEYKENAENYTDPYGSGRITELEPESSAD